MRRRGRECALQILYQMDVGRDIEAGVAAARIDEVLAAFWGSFETVAQADKDFCERLVRGVVGDLAAVDAAIAKVSQHWRMNRMDKVDRNVLRIAAYEILRCPDIPRAASINEAIEIGKRYGGKESAAFINGILDQLGRDGGSAQEAGDGDEGAKDVGVDPT